MPSKHSGEMFEWTSRRKAQLLAMRADGMSFTEIGECLDISAALASKRHREAKTEHHQQLSSRRLAGSVLSYRTNTKRGSAMSLYMCECGEKTYVIDTRSSYKRLRRRRKCKSCGHRFSTVEVPLEATEQLKNVVEHWTNEIEDGDEIAGYLIAEIHRIMLGTTPPPDT